MKRLTQSEYNNLNIFAKIGHKILLFFALIGRALVRFWKAFVHFCTLSRSEYFKINFFAKIGYKILRFFIGIGRTFKNIGVGIAKGVVAFGKGIAREATEFVQILIKGSWMTKLSLLIMGFGNFARKQFVRGTLFLSFQAVFIWYMIKSGIGWISKLDNLGDIEPQYVEDPVYQVTVRIDGDDSFKILLYGVLTIMLCLLFIFLWRMNFRHSFENDKLVRAGKKVPSFKDDVHDLVDKKFHITLLTVPILGISLFTIFPIIFMILVAFTNMDGAHDGYAGLFTWIGNTNFKQFFSMEAGGLGYAFTHILGWTIVWAIFATFSNYFLGMLLAIMINKKGIKFKKIWRSIFVLTIAIPQFISLLYMSKLFAKNGLIVKLLMDWGILQTQFDFWANTVSSRILVILINIWVGVPYLMLIATGILMNIPEDLYESAKIDGANPVQQYFKITLPYMLFITGPYLLTSFIGNMNNFNVIYLLTNGSEPNPALSTAGGSASNVDLLVTWLFNITMGPESNYKFAAVVSILIFVVISTFSLIGFNAMQSNKNEEDFQ